MEVNVSVIDRVAVTIPIDDGVEVDVGVPEPVGDCIGIGLAVLLIVIAGVGAKGWVRRTHTREIIPHNPKIPSISRTEALEVKSTFF